MKTSVLVLASLWLVCSSNLQAKESIAAKPFPQDVQKIMDRKACCGHWMGEEPYDADRKKEIAKALKECRCDSFDSDLKKIQKKYESDKKILHAIESVSSDE